MEYISPKVVSGKWDVSERRIQNLYEENSIESIICFSRVWVIPKDAETPKMAG